MSNHYDTLGVTRDASENEIRNAYIKLSKELHPDINGEDDRRTERLQSVNYAYEILGDRTKRYSYNNSLSELLPVIKYNKSQNKKGFQSSDKRSYKRKERKDYSFAGNQQSYHHSSEEQLFARNGRRTIFETKRLVNLWNWTKIILIFVNIVLLALIFMKISKLYLKPQTVMAEKMVVKEKTHKKTKKRRRHRSVHQNIPAVNQSKKNNSDSLILLERSKLIEGLRIVDTLRIENKRDKDQNPAYQ